jgi:hypothetical protein
LQKDGAPGMLILAKGDYFEPRRIPLVVRKKLLWHFHYKFDIPMASFYNPDLIQ